MGAGCGIAYLAAARPGSKRAAVQRLRGTIGLPYPATRCSGVLSAEALAAAFPSRAAVAGELASLREAGLAADLGAAFGQASQTLSTLARYEAGLERAFYRALHELQRLQAARAGHAVPPPIAVDVTVTVDHLDGSDEDDDA